MSEYEEFPVEEERASSPFLPLAGLLIAIFVLAVVCSGIVLAVRGSNGNQAASGTATAIAGVNATTLAQTAQVTATLLAMTEEASRPTATATNTPVPPTNTPTQVPAVTSTSVVQEIDTTETPIAEGTSIFGGGDLASTATAIPGGGTDGSGGGSLPQTGFGPAEAVLLALGLLVVLVIARRLRAS
jgi:hypothetical protein